MQKITSVLKSKRFIRIASGAVAVVVLAATSLSVMLPSYFAYQDYYNAVMHEKYLESLPLELKGITAKLANGVEYYTDGMAKPENGDLEVAAQFSEKGKDFEKMLSEELYEITVPDDFKENGGKIGVTYTFTPEEEPKEGEQVEPIVKTAEVEVSLTKVALKELKVTQSPYRVYYSDVMKFDPEGMTFEAKYNNGHTVSLTADDITVENTENLTVGTTEAKLSYTNDGVKVEATTPVTVDAAADYNDGAVLKIEPIGELTADEGVALTDLQPKIAAYYQSGNRLPLSADKYVVEGNTEKATFTNNCILKVSLKANQTISCKAVAAVQYNVEAENAVLVGGEKKTVTKTDGNQAVVMQKFANDNTITLNVHSTGIVKGNLYVKLANFGAADVNLSKAFTATVNGKLVYLPSTVVSKAASQNVYDISDYLMFSPVLMSGDNTIVLKAVGNEVSNVAIDKFTYETRFEGAFYSNMGEYIVGNSQNLNFTVSKVGDWNTFGKPYTHGICTDGEYIYGVHTSWANSDTGRAYVVSKQNKTTGELVAASPATEAKGLENLAGVTYYDGKIIVFFKDGTKAAIGSDLSGAWTAYDGFDFEGLDGKPLYDVCYSNSRKQFAVRSSSTGVTVFGADKKVVQSFVLSTDSAGSLMRMTADENYIYAVYSSNGHFQPAVRVFDWTGKAVANFTVNNNNTILGLTKPENSNVQGIAMVDDDLYFSVICFTQGDRSDCGTLIKASYPEISDELEVNLGFGEYVDTCINNSVTPAAKGKAIATIEKGGYAMGGCSDGEFTYISVDGGGNTSANVYKLNSSNEVVASSSAINVGGTGDNARLFIKDDLLYCVGGNAINGKLYSVALKDFIGSSVKFEESTLSFADIGNIKDVTYNANAERFALVEYSGSSLIIVDKNNREVARTAATYPSMSISSITSDSQYIYVSYIVNNQSVLPIDMFTWDGTKIGTVLASDISLGEGVNFNVQSIFIIDDEMYASVCSWDSGMNKYHLWKITCDTSVIK